jgi:hypothetical protein
VRHYSYPSDRRAIRAGDGWRIRSAGNGAFVTDNVTHESPGVGRLVSDLTKQASELVRAEVHLAQVEMTAKAGHAGKGIGAFSAAGLLAFFAIAAGLAAGILGLATVVAPWLAALIVMAVLLLAAGLAALGGKKEIEQATPTPERTVESVKQDVTELKEHAHR